MNILIPIRLPALRQSSSGTPIKNANGKNIYWNNFLSYLISKKKNKYTIEFSITPNPKLWRLIIEKIQTKTSFKNANIPTNAIKFAHILDTIIITFDAPLK